MPMITAAQAIPLLISALAFAVVILFFFGVLQAYRRLRYKRELVRKVHASAEAWESPEKLDILLAKEPKEGKRLLYLLSSFGKRILPEESQEYARSRMNFVRAGLRRSNFPTLFFGIKGSLALVLPSAFFLARFWIREPLKANLTLGILLFLALCGFYLPEIWLRRRITKRKQAIFEGLPDALDLLVVCVEAGMGLDAAMNRVAEEMELANKPLSDELQLFNLELRAGKLRQEAMKNLAQRIDLEDMNTLTTLLIQTDRFGTSLAGALRVYSDSFRTKRYMMAEELAAKLPTKLMVPLILFIFPGLFAAIMGPAIIRLLEVLSHR